jgi:hypothetical protein
MIWTGVGLSALGFVSCAGPVFLNWGRPSSTWATVAGYAVAIMLLTGITLALAGVVSAIADFVKRKREEAGSAGDEPGDGRDG